MNSPAGFPWPIARACSAAPTNRSRSASLALTKPRATAWPSRSISRAVSLRSSTRTSSSRGAGRPPGAGTGPGTAGDGLGVAAGLAGGETPGEPVAGLVGVVAGVGDRAGAGEGGTTGAGGEGRIIGRAAAGGLGITGFRLPFPLRELNPSRPAGGGVLVLNFLLSERIAVKKRGCGWRGRDGRRGCGSRDRSGRWFPAEVDAIGPPPAVHGPLAVVALDDEPAEVDELVAGGDDLAFADAEGPGDPGGLEPPPAVGLAAPAGEAAEEGRQGDGDGGGAGPPGQEAEERPGDDERALAAADGVGEGREQVVGERGRLGEGDGGFGPGEQAGGDEVLDQEPGALLGDVEEPGQLGEAVSGLGAFAGEGAAFDHLDAGEPGAELADAEFEPLAGEPDGQEVADRVWRRSRRRWRPWLAAR